MENIQKLIDEKGVIRIPDKDLVCIFKSTPTEKKELSASTKIGPNTFSNMPDLVEVYIPKTVTDIEWCFYECYNLKHIYVSDENPKYCDIDGVLYNKEKDELIAYPNAHGKEYAIPEGVKEIAHYAFKSCKDIETIHLPESLKTINHNAFYRCTSLKSIELPDGIKNIGDTVGDSKVDIDYIYKGKTYKLEEIQALVNSKK